MSEKITCFGCKFFSPGEHGCPSYYRDPVMDEFEEDITGICRRHIPRHGKTIKKSNGVEFICFAEWPKVMACDWCGEFEPRHARDVVL